MNAFPSGSFDFERRVPHGDTHARMVCRQCSWIHYENPRVIVAALCLWQNQVLLCRRAIAPRYGFWTLPGGFMEIGETLEQATCREVREEAGAAIQIDSLLATYSVPRIGQVHMVYLASMESPTFCSGEESLDVRLFPCTEAGLPWEELAFPVNHWTLRDFLSLHGQPLQSPFTYRPEHASDRMSPVPFHPDFPPPQLNTDAGLSPEQQCHE